MSSPALVRSLSMSGEVLVIGGNAAGMTAAGRAKRLDPSLQVTVVEPSHFISYSICGLPHYIFGEVENHEDLIVFTPERLKRERGIEALVRVKAVEILPGRRCVVCRHLDEDREFELSYDRLVLATGYLPEAPNVEGVALEGVLTLSRLEDGIRLRHAITAGGRSRVAVVGGGYVGLMMTHGLTKQGAQVTLLERNRQVYSQVDEDLARLIEKEMERNGVRLFLSTRVERLTGANGRVQRVTAGEVEVPADLVLLDVGIRPNTKLGAAAGVACGTSGALQTDARGQTSLAGVYAAGNCAETRNLITGRAVFSKLGTTAARQGRVVGENLAGWRSEFPGTLETSIEKVFNLSVARTGLTLRQALSAGFDADGALISHTDRAGYLSGSRPLHVKVIFDRSSRKLLGGQLIGQDAAGKRIDTMAAALTAGMRLEDLAGLDLAYAPPYGTLWDPFQIAAHAAMRGLL